jgi:hypothetical protein
MSTSVPHERDRVFGTHRDDGEDGGRPHTIRVIDVVTGEASTVAEGRAAIWLDDDTLLVDV